MRALRLLLLSVLSLALLGAAAPASFTPYLVKDIDPYPSPASSNPTGFATLGRLALFQVAGWSVDADRQGLWRSDGTASGTYRLIAAEYVQSLVTAGDRCFFGFLADDHWYLGVTDGTLPGTFTLTEVKPWWGSSGAWVPQQRVFYFPLPADSPDVHATKLWRSDGTPGGTYEVADIAAVPGASDLRELTSFQGRLYFAAGSALWRSDGTAAGTVKVFDVQAASLQVVGSSLVFAGTDSQGSELWASDGTSLGTRRLTDLTPGAGSTTFNAFKVAGK